MSYKTTIVAINAGFTPPEEAIAKVMDEHKSLVGFASALTVEPPDLSGGDPTQVLETFVNTELPPIKEIMEHLEQYKDDYCILVFADFPKKFEEESYQPFIILKADDADDGEPLLIAAIDGNFPAHSADGQDGAVIVADILRGTLARFLKNADDMDSMMTEIISDEAIPRMIRGLYKDRATILILAENGVDHIWGEDPLRVKFEWGWMSKACGYSEAKEETPKPGVVEKVVSAVKTFGSGRRTGKEAPVTQTSAGSLQSASSEQTVIHKETNADAAYLMVSAPEEATKDQTRTFYKRANEGIVPTGFKNKPQIKILRSRWEKLLADPAFRRDTGMKELKIQEVEAIVSSNITEASATEIIPKAPPTELKTHKDAFMKRPTVVKIINEGRGIIDPKLQQATEDKYATYPEIAGHSSVMDLYAYSNEDWLDLIKRTPVLAMIAIGNLVGECIRRTPEEELNPQVEAQPEPQRATGTTGKAQVTVSTAAGKPPVKSGGVRQFGNNKK